MIGIVGAGISGLALNHYLREAGASTVVFEADDEPGGVIRSRRVDGHVLEGGPQRLRLTPTIEGLASAVGIDDEFVTSDDLPLYMYRDGRLRRAPLSPRAAVTTDLLTWREKARILAEPLTAGPKEGETVADYVRRKFGDGAYEYLFGPLYGGIYSSDPEEMPLEYSLGKALDHAGIGRSVLLSVAGKLLGGRDRPPMLSFEGGLQRLPEALYERHADSVRLETAVETVAADGDGYVVETADESVVVDDVVVTTPGGVAESLLADVASDAAERLGRLSYNPLVVVHLRSDYELDGAGFKVPTPEGRELRGITAHDALFDREGVFTAFLGGGHAPDLVDESDDHLAALAVEEFAAVTGADAEALDVNRVLPGMPAYDRSWSALDGLELPDGIHLCTNYVARAGIPGRIRQARRMAESLAADDGDEQTRAAPSPA